MSSGDLGEQVVIEQIGEPAAGKAEHCDGSDGSQMETGRVGPGESQGQDHEAGQRELSGCETYGVEPLQLGLGNYRRDGIGEGSERNHDGAAKDSAGGMLSSGVSGVAGNHDQHSAEAEENAGNGKQRGPGAVDRHGENQSPDGGSGVEHRGYVAGDGALTPGKEGEGESVVEEGDGQQPGQQAAGRRLFAAETEHGPE